MKTTIRYSVVALLLFTTLSLYGETDVTPPVSAKNDSLYNTVIRDSSFQRVSFNKQYIYIADDLLKTTTIDSLDNIAIDDSMSQTINYAEKNVYVARNTNKLGKTDIDTLQQKITYYEPLKASHHWFVTGNAGGLLYIGESDRRGPFFNRIAPALELGVGKWVSPYVGLRLMYSGIQARGHIAISNSNNTAQTDKIINGNWYKQKWGLNFYHLDVMVDFMGNAWENKQKTSVYSLRPYASFGMLSSPEIDKPGIAFGGGLNNVFRLGDNFDLNVDLKGILANDRFDTEYYPNEGLKFEGIAYLTVGLTYKFKTSKRKSLRNIHVNNQYISYYKIPKSDCTTHLKSDADTQKEETNNILFTGAPIFFEINSSTLSNRAKLSVSFIAEVIKKAPKDRIFTVVGYSDKQTGNDDFNLYVSKERAKAVFNALINEGVDKSMLKLEYKGGVETMYLDDNTLSRIVIVK